jgi:hypothetical protein
MQSIPIPFGEWKPDLPPFMNDGATVAQNVIGKHGGYDEHPSLTVVSDAMTARCRGAFTSIDADGNIRLFTADATTLYQLTTTEFEDVTGTAIDPGDAENVEFAQWGNTVVASYYSTGAVETQTITLGAANFTELITSTRKPRAAHIATFKDFLIMGRTYDAVDGSQPHRVWWSAIGDNTDFDPDSATQCDWQELEENDGWIKRVVSAKDYVVIVTERSIWRMTYQGGDTIFQFDKMVGNRGTVASGSIASIDRLMFTLDADGFYAFDGTNPVPIGKGKVDQTFFNKVATTHLDKISSVVDPDTSTYCILFPSTDSQDGIPDFMWRYHWPTGKWTEIDIDAEWLVQDKTKGYTLESLDDISASIDDLTPSLDSRFWTGGNNILSAIDTAHKLANFNGDPLDAVLETGEVQPFNGKRTYCDMVQPFVDGTAATTTIQVGTRELHTAANSFDTAISLNAWGWAEARISARYMRFRANISGGFDHAQGIKVQVRPAGAR